jgi:hypothetical protein
MTQERALALLAAYGADPARWPEAERADAVAWFATHQDRVADALMEARAVDASLAIEGPQQLASEALVTRVLAAAPGSNVTVLRPRAFGVRAMAALAACAMLGVVVGFGSVGGRAQDPIGAEADAAFGEAFDFDTGTSG